MHVPSTTSWRVVAVAVATACGLGAGAGCDPKANGEEGPSSLEKLAAEKEAEDEGSKAQGHSAGEDPNDPDPASEGGEPPADARRVKLALALTEGTYRVTSIGQVMLPLVNRSTVFAREEEVTLADCEGEGEARTCALEHRYTQYEAEPPAGRALESDHARIKDLVTRQKITTTGALTSETTVEGPKEQLDSALGKQLSAVDRFFCLRFPDNEVAVGAHWVSECHAVVGGRLVGRKLEWELIALDEDPEMGLRAELKISGRMQSIKAPDAPPGTEVARGTFQGVLYFMASAGEPLQFRQKMTMQIGNDGLKTTTDLKVQFARLDPSKDPKDPEAVMRPDGKPFPEGTEPVDPTKPTQEPHNENAKKKKDGSAEPDE